MSNTRSQSKQKLSDVAKDLGISNQELIVAELKRCADEMASCDVSMQTIRNMIHDKQF